MPREPRLYRYVVRYDDGIAPNPEGDFCTLAICKPGIRGGAQRGDLILGFASKHRGEAKLIFAMQIDNSMSFADYWRDRRFRGRSDNIYRPRANGDLVPMQPGVHVSEEERRRDWRGHNVLISAPGSWWYFGGSAPRFSEIVSQELKDRLWYPYQGHKWAGAAPGDIETVLVALRKYEPPGRRGQPWDRSPFLAPTHHGKCRVLRTAKSARTSRSASYC